MKRYNIFIIQIIALFFINFTIAQNKAIPSKGNLVKISQKLTQLQNVDESSLYNIYDKNGRKQWPKNIAKPHFTPQANQSNDSFNDNLLQKELPALRASAQNNVIQGFEGLATGVQPMDPTIAVGSNYVIELVNAAPTTKMRIWDKNGNVLINQITLQAISGFPGYGDPIALYDKENDRYIVTEFMIKNHNNSTENGLIIMVSENNDPTGQWYVYKWIINKDFTLDYPKWSVNSDGIYVHTNNFSQTVGVGFQGSFFIAFNKAQMYSGNSTFDALRITQAIGNTYAKYATCPAQPQGDGILSNDQIFVTKQNNKIILIETPVDWSTNSFTQNQIGQINIGNYNETICSAPRQACIDQPNNGSKLEALTLRIMNQPIIRKFNNNTTGIVLSFTVNANGKAGIRWVELINNGFLWHLKQEATWHVDNNHQFIPSIAYDKFGNIALAYSTSGTSLFPSIRYTGRYATDPLNQMSLPENILKDGNAVSYGSRWGDYNHLVADPDGKSFWMVAMYGKSGAFGGKGTYISNFSLVDSCPSDLTITQNVNSGQTDTQTASNTITAINTIYNGATAAYDAGQTVYLKPNFYAKNGADFHAFIAGCQAGRYAKSTINNSKTASKVALEEDTTALNNEEAIKLYPNPTTGVLKIASTAGIASWVITNTYGKTYFNGKQENTTIDMSNLPNGIYFLKAIYTNGRVVTKTIIKK